VGGSGGPNGATDAYRVVVPISNPETQKGLLKLAAASANTHSEVETPEIVAVNVLQVPSQTSLEQKLQFEEERVETQRQMLRSARDAAAEMGVSLRTRAIVGRDVGGTILDVIEEEEADQVLIGAHKPANRRQHVFGSKLDAVLENAPCEVSMVDLANDEIGTPVALAGPGPHAPVAARRAFEFATIDEKSPVLLNVQQPAENTDEFDPHQRGEEMIDEIADRAGLEPDDYESEVLVDDDIASAILERVDSYDTVCAGVSTKISASRILFGSLAERIERQASGNVVMVRGPYDTSTSVRDAIAERLTA
jgi:nucleotide-binding universal stress UspA family protein